MELSVIDMIYDKVKAIDTKLDVVCNTQTEMRLNDAEMKARLSAVELKTVELRDAVHELEKKQDKHNAEEKLHFNPYFNESMPQKLWRKKPEIVTGVSFSSIIAGFLYLLFEYIKARG